MVKADVRSSNTLSAQPSVPLSLCAERFLDPPTATRAPEIGVRFVVRTDSMLHTYALSR